MLMHGAEDRTGTVDSPARGRRDRLSPRRARRGDERDGARDRVEGTCALERGQPSHARGRRGCVDRRDLVLHEPGAHGAGERHTSPTGVVAPSAPPDAGRLRRRRDLRPRSITITDRVHHELLWCLAARISTMAVRASNGRFEEASEEETMRALAIQELFDDRERTTRELVARPRPDRVSASGSPIRRWIAELVGPTPVRPLHAADVDDPRGDCGRQRSARAAGEADRASRAGRAGTRGAGRVGPNRRVAGGGR